MLRRGRLPGAGDRRALALDASGLVLASRRRLPQQTVWALEQHDGALWQLQGMSADPASTARFLREPAPL